MIFDTILKMFLQGAGKMLAGEIEFVPINKRSNHA